MGGKLRVRRKFTFKERAQVALIYIGIVAVIAAFIALGVWWDIARWHTFQEVTHSDIGFWKWQFFFNSNHK